MTKVALYARVSDDKIMEDGTRRQDVNRQIEKLKAYATRSHYIIEDQHIYIDDGKSAFKDDYNNRPAFRKLLNQIKQRHVQRVLVEDLTRWYRNLEEGLRTLKETSQAGCTITSIQEGEIDVTSTEGWMKASFSLLFAEWASRVHSEKVRSGMKRAGNDRRRTCQSCNIVHTGRHPLTCQCYPCKRTHKRKGGVKNSEVTINTEMS